MVHFFHEFISPCTAAFYFIHALKSGNTAGAKSATEFVFFLNLVLSALALHLQKVLLGQPFSLGEHL